MRTNLLILSILSFKLSFSQFSRTYDKYNNEVVLNYNTPYLSINKYIKDQDTTYQTAFYLYDTYLTASGTDAIILFSNDEKIELDGKVDVDYAKNGYYRYTFYSYEKSLVEKLSVTSLVGFKLHIFDKQLNQQNRNLIMTAAKKILISK